MGKTISGSTTDREVYVYDGENMVLKFQNSTGNALTNANLVRRYLNGSAVDQVFAEEVTSGSSSVQTRWLLADNEGTIRDVATYAAGVTTVQDHLVYDSFGNVTQNHPAYAPTFTFTGQRYDADSQLYYYRARWYDSKTGQFTSHDPLGFAAGDPNLYRYCGNSPTNFTDSSGCSGGSGGSGGDGWGGQSDPTTSMKAVKMAEPDVPMEPPPYNPGGEKGGGEKGISPIIYATSSTTTSTTIWTA